MITEKVEALVIGAGVSGLTSGIRLLENNFSITIIADKFPPKTLLDFPEGKTSNKHEGTTSDIPAAVWYPYLPDVSDEAYKEKVKKWAGATYKKGYELAKDSKSGVSIVKFTQLFTKDEKDPPWWEECVEGFRFATDDELPPDCYKAGYTIEVPLFETPTYMPYLVKEFKRLGGRIEEQSISNISELDGENRLIVNCAGLGAREIVEEETDLHPKRGQIIRVKASGVDRCLLDETPTPNTSIFGYIVPRSNDCILGGTAQENDWYELPDHETAKEIVERCKRLAPNLKILKVLEHKVGLRPERFEVRLEPNDKYKPCTVIHNYGHSGSGFTLSWGCADEVVKLAQDASLR